jgi:sulfatase modifying factor 1
MSRVSSLRWLCSLAIMSVAPALCLAVSMDLVPVGNPGNPGELSGNPTAGIGGMAICGGVNYTYQIGRFEVTLGQYTAFLNAVATTDTYALYNPYMWGPWGYQIQRNGASGGYTYSVTPDWANRPVNYVSWGDAARFANWLTHGQPNGDQTAATTEDGSYPLNGAMTDAELLAVTRKPIARYVIPTEDEWYKAAYHKNDGPTDHYWKFPTGTDVVPSNELVSPDPGNNANMPGTLGDPYFRTEVGAFTNSRSAYGTYDQGGNVWEWNEDVFDSSARGLRGGSYNTPVWVGDGTVHSLSSEYRYGAGPTWETSGAGFRVALVPEPATINLLALCAAAAMIRRRRIG